MKNGEIKIEKGIPIAPHANGGSEINDALRKMKEGDSIVLPLGKRYSIPQRAKSIGISAVNTIQVRREQMNINILGRHVNPYDSNSRQTGRLRR